MTDTADRQESEARPPMATVGVGVIPAASAAVSTSRYDYFGDEFYFLAAGRRTSFG